MTDFMEALSGGLTESEIPFTEQHLIRCQKYHDLLLEWNQKMNLTSIEDSREIAIKHFIDSLWCVKYLNIPAAASLIDVGTGAGFPGLPVKIFFPHIKLVLLDSLEKRCKFLAEAVKMLELENITIIHGRAEEKGKEKAFREQFSLVTARAVTSLPVLAEYCLPLLHVGGYFFALKGPDIQEEVKKGEKAIQTMGGEFRETHYYRLPLSGDPRSLVVVEKIKPTPEKYPRKPGVPAKQPLL